MEYHNCVPYQRKTLYLVLTVPMMVIYIAIALLLWQINVVFFAIYAALFVLVAIFMSYVCVYWECPYVGRFGPCVGGFCLPASQIARLHKKSDISETCYNLFLNLAYLSFFGIILFPIYFLFVKGFLYLLGYIGVVVVYWLLFTLFICPFCATRNICPGGQAAVKIQEAIASWHSNAK
jgi:hypothetical protein